MRPILSRSEADWLIQLMKKAFYCFLMFCGVLWIAALGVGIVGEVVGWGDYLWRAYSLNRASAAILYAS